MSLLITSTLIGSVDWFNKCPYSWREKALADLKNMLNRVWTTPGPAIQRGIDFEKKVYNLLRSGRSRQEIDNLNCSEHFKKVLRLCQGGTFQTKNKSMIEVNGKEYCLFGKEDVTFLDRIYDIKTTTIKSFKKSKYSDSFQHKIYLHNTQKKLFKYIVAVFTEAEGNEIDRVEEIDANTDSDGLKHYRYEIVEKIKELDAFFNQHPTLKKSFEEKYSKPY